MRNWMLVLGMALVQAVAFGQQTVAQFTGFCLDAGGQLLEEEKFARRIKDEMKVEGEAKVRQIHIDPRNGQVAGPGGAWHPSIKTHRKMVAKWVAVLEKDLGWQQVK